MNEPLTNRDKAIKIMETLTNPENGYTHQELLEHIIGNFLSGEKALEAMTDCIFEFPSPDYDDFTEDDEED